MAASGSDAIWGRAEQQDFRSRVRGCLLGGAIGDALGAGIEFDSLSAIRAAHGATGVTDYVPAYGRRGAVTDDTQMTLFTVDGLIRAHVRRDTGAWHPPTDVHPPTCAGPPPSATGGPDERKKDDGWLAREEWLYARRAPGNACLSGLGDERMGTLEKPKNPESKGCGDGHALRAVRAAGRLGAAAGLPARRRVRGADPRPPHRLSRRRRVRRDRARPGPRRGPGRAPCSRRWRSWRPGPGHEETTDALKRALGAVRQGMPTPERVEALGEGWTAEEALAIGVYCALVAEDVRHGLLLAVNHGGDSDSTGSVCGNLLGAMHGETALPPGWVAELEGRATILRTRRRLRDGDDAGAGPARTGRLVAGLARPLPARLSATGPAGAGNRAPSAWSADGSRGPGSSLTSGRCRPCAAGLAGHLRDGRQPGRRTVEPSAWLRWVSRGSPCGRTARSATKAVQARREAQRRPSGTLESRTATVRTVGDVTSTHAPLAE